MPTDVIMPQMGESIFEGTITKWLKQPGDKVQRDEPLFEISTDKVDAEIPAPASGTLQDIKVQAGSHRSGKHRSRHHCRRRRSRGEWLVHSALRLQPRQAQPPARDGSRAKQTEAAQASQRRSRSRFQPTLPTENAGLDRQRQGTEWNSPRRAGKAVRSSPLVRRIAKENNVDLAQVPAPAWAAASPRKTSRRSSSKHAERRRASCSGSA